MQLTIIIVANVPSPEMSPLFSGNWPCCSTTDVVNVFVVVVVVIVWTVNDFDVSRPEIKEVKIKMTMLDHAAGVTLYATGPGEGVREEVG